MISEDMLRVSEDIKTIKELMRNTFEANWDPGLFRLKFHLLYYAVEDLEKFADLNSISSSPFQRYNVHIKYTF